MRKRREERSLKPLQVELLKLQKHLESEGRRMIILFEGRDAAGTQRHGQDDGADADPRRPQQPLAQELAARLAPRQHRRDRHEEQQLSLIHI